MRVRKRTYKSGKAAWVLDGRLHGERVQLTLHGAKNRKDAEQMASEVWSQAHKKALGLTADLGRAVTLGEWLRYDADRAGIREATRRTHEEQAKVLCRILGASTRLDELRTFDVERLKRLRSKEGVSARTINLALELLRATLKRAKKHGVRVPQCEVELMGQTAGLRRFLSAKEVRAIVEACSNQNARECIAFAAATGLRAREQREMVWDDIDADLATATVETTKRGAHGQVRMCQIVLGRPARAVLLWKRRRGERRGRVFPSWPRRSWLKNAARVAGVSWYESLRWHDLRHAFAMMHLDRGASVHEVAALLRHSTPRLVLTVYGRARPELVRSKGMELSW